MFIAKNLPVLRNIHVFYFYTNTIDSLPTTHIKDKACCIETHCDAYQTKSQAKFITWTFNTP